MPASAPNIPSPDPSLATNERLAHAIGQLRTEVKGWIDSLQILLEKGIIAGNEIIKTRLDGNDTALVAAFKAQTEEAAKQTLNFKEILSEIKAGIEKRFDSVNEKIDDLKSDSATSGGRSQGTGHIVTLIIAGCSAVAAVVSMIVVLTQHAAAP